MLQGKKKEKNNLPALMSPLKGNNETGNEGKNGDYDENRGDFSLTSNSETCLQLHIHTHRHIHDRSLFLSS